MTTNNLTTNDITKELNDFLDSLTEIDRAIITKKIKLFAESDSKIVAYDSTTERFSPEHLKMDFVHCNFTGVGFEWDGPHYALIWDVNPKFDSVMVIPTTSQDRKDIPSIISVGNISGLPDGKSTTLLVSDMTRVSRKRLEPVLFEHPKKGLITVRLPMIWMDRIREAIAVTYTNEKTFEQILMGCRMDMVSDIRILREWRFRPVKGNYDSTTNTLSVRLWNSDITHSFKLLSPKKAVTRGLKKELINNLLSKDPDVKQKAELLYNEHY